MGELRFFCMVNGSHKGVPLAQMKFHVSAAGAGLIGTYVDGKPYVPDAAAFRAALPYRWRKAFARDGAFWHDKHSDKAGCRTTLRDNRGRYIATIYCFARES